MIPIYSKNPKWLDTVLSDATAGKYHLMPKSLRRFGAGMAASVAGSDDRKVAFFGRAGNDLPDLPFQSQQYQMETLFFRIVLYRSSDYFRYFTAAFYTSGVLFPWIYAFRHHYFHRYRVS